MKYFFILPSVRPFIKGGKYYGPMEFFDFNPNPTRLKGAKPGGRFQAIRGPRIHIFQDHRMDSKMVALLE